MSSCIEIYSSASPSLRQKACNTFEHLCSPSAQRAREHDAGNRGRGTGQPEANWHGKQLPVDFSSSNFCNSSSQPESGQLLSPALSSSYLCLARESPSHRMRRPLLCTPGEVIQRMLFYSCFFWVLDSCFADSLYWKKYVWFISAVFSPRLRYCIFLPWGLLVQLVPVSER